ncbi:MAG: hypothetical protein GY822_02010 [Deltaproteobacteria bacterium]|nr:hypothetical protein [Deltaproteobacteria bacterium]
MHWKPLIFLVALLIDWGPGNESSSLVNENRRIFWSSNCDRIGVAGKCDGENLKAFGMTFSYKIFKKVHGTKTENDEGFRQRRKTLLNVL